MFSPILRFPDRILRARTRTHLALQHLTAGAASHLEIDMRVPAAMENAATFGRSA